MARQAAASKNTTGTIKVTLVRSYQGLTEKMKCSVRGLGLKKIGQTRELQNVAPVRGMIKKVIHLLKVEE